MDVTNNATGILERFVLQYHMSSSTTVASI